MKLIEFNPENLDASEITVGEKEELRTMCESFNRDFGERAWNREQMRYTNVGDPIISYTDKLIMKRGSYDRIKQAYRDKVLKFNIRNSDLYNLTNKIQDSSYYQSRFVSQLRRIQDKVWTMKRSGLHNIDDEAEIMPKMNIMMNSILNHFNILCKFIEKTNNNDDIFTVSADLFLHNDTKPDHRITDVDISEDTLLDANYRSIQLRLHIVFGRIHINVYNNQNTNDPITRIPMKNIEIAVDMPLFSSFNDHWANIDVENNQMSSNIYRTRKNRTIDLVKVIGVNNNSHGNTHPFISGGMSNLAKEVNTCTSDFQNEIHRTMFMHDYVSCYLSICKWLTTYVINYTHPLNGITRSFYGHPEWLSEDAANILGTSVNNCSVFGMREEINDYFKYKLNKDDHIMTADPLSVCEKCKVSKTCNTYNRFRKDGMYFQLCVNYATNYNVDWLNRLEYKTLNEVPEDQQMAWLHHNVVQNDELNFNYLLAHEKIFQMNFVDSQLIVLLKSWYKRYLEHVETMDFKNLNDDYNVKSLHEFIAYNVHHNQILDEDYEEIDVAYVNSISMMQEDEFNYEQRNNKVEGETDDDYRRDMEEYMNNLMATGQVREAQPRRRT